MQALELKGHTFDTINDVCKQLKHMIHDVAGASIDIEKLTKMFESLRIGSIVKTHFILLIRDMQSKHDSNM